MQETNPDVKVVVEPEAIEEAYRMGYDEFEGMDTDDPDEFEFSYFTDSARWTNSILPSLRCMAGARDPTGKGTYTSHGDIVIVEFPEDRPMNGDTTESQFLFEKLVDAYRYGAYDSVEGDDPNVDRHFSIE